MVVRDVLGGSVLVSVLALSGCGGGGGGDSTADDGGGTTTPQTVVAGSIGIEANTRVDQDTSDFLSFSSDPTTDPVQSTQALPSTVIAAGYVSADSGVRNVSNPYDDYAKDSVDRYSITLAEGDTVTIQTFDASTTHAIRLVLSDQTTELDSDSTDPSVPKLTAKVQLPAGKSSATYFIDVQTDIGDPGPVRYVLTKAPSSQSLAFDWPRYDFVPGEAIVSMTKGTAASPTALSALSATPVKALGSDRWLMRMPASLATNASSQAEATLDWVAQMRKGAGVEQASPNYIMHAQVATTEPLYRYQWHYDLINAPAAWQLAPNAGSGVRVAVLDTGMFRYSGAWHPDLLDNTPPLGNTLLSGSDFVSAEYDNDPVVYGGSGPDSNPADPGNAVGTNVFHGTHVAGTIAASGTNNEGGTGIAFQSTLIPARVLGEGGAGSLADLLNALAWVGTNNRADIVNLSLGGLPYDSRLEAALKALNDQDILVVAAAGNDAASTRTYPGASDYVFGVSAVDGAGALASYSNFGSWVDLAAPGGDASRDANLDGRADLVLSASAIVGDNGLFEPAYIGLQGTSMAAPHVAGVFALMKQVNNAITPTQVRGWLQVGGLTKGGDGSRSDALGYGIIDAAKSVTTAGGAPVNVLSPSPSVITLNTETQLSSTVDLEVYGDPNLITINTTVTSPPWLTVSVDDSTSPATLTASLNTSSPELEPGVPLSTNLTLDYDDDGTARTLTIPVSAQVVTDEQQRNAGVHFVLLVNTTPDAQGFYQAEAQVVARVENGEYQFSFPLENGDGVQTQSEVTPGDYFLVAGTDLDNDGIICQPGEACAEYPVSGLREAIHVDQNTDLTNIRMTTGFSRPTISAATPDVLPRPDFAGYRLIPEDDFVRPLKKLSGE